MLIKRKNNPPNPLNPRLNKFRSNKLKACSLDVKGYDAEEFLVAHLR